MTTPYQSQHAESAEGFTASCTHCGAPQSLVLDGQLRPCVYCKASDPLDAASRARVQSATSALSRIAAREQMRLNQYVSRVWSIGLETPALAVPCWLLFGGIAWAVVHGDQPKGVSLISFLTHGIAGHADKGALAAWWVYFMTITLGLVTLASYLFLLWRARAQIQPAPSMAPLQQGGPARCHLCGAGLQGSEAHRSCKACGASNLVDGDRFSVAARDLFSQVQQLEALDANLQGALSDWSGRILYVAAFIPILLLVGLPIGWFAPGTYPKLLVIPGVIALLSLPLAGLIFSQSLPAVPLVVDVPLGGVIRARGLAYRVYAKLDVNLMQIPTGTGVLVMLAPPNANQPTLALVRYSTDDNHVVEAFAVSAGGAPLQQEMTDPSRLSLVTITQAQGPVQAAAVREETPIRLFGSSSPKAGETPWWTLTRIHMAPEEILVDGSR